MDFSKAFTDWNYVAKFGEPLRADDVKTSLHRHDVSDQFSWELKEARGGHLQNPFMVEAANSSSSLALAQAHSQSQSQNPHATQRPYRSLHIIHGGLAGLAFLVMFPAGGIIIRLENFSRGIWVHAGMQIVAWSIAIGAAGISFYLAKSVTPMRFTHPHVIVGVVLMAIILGQPALGWMHHKAFKQNGNRSSWSWAHISIGRIAIVMGMVNAGLGLSLSGHTRGIYVIGYGVVCGVMGVSYLAAIIYGELKLRKVRPSREETGSEGILREASDEQYLNQPLSLRPLRLQKPGIFHRHRERTEYFPLAVERTYVDMPASRPASPQRRSRSASSSRL